MEKEKKSFFFFPTWILVVLSVLFFGATVFDIYLIANLDSFPAITINGVEYSQGTEEYSRGIARMRNSFTVSAVVTFIISLTNGFYAYKRYRKYGR